MALGVCKCFRVRDARLNLSLAEVPKPRTLLRDGVDEGDAIGRGRGRSPTAVLQPEQPLPQPGAVHERALHLIAGLKVGALGLPGRPKEERQPSLGRPLRSGDRGRNKRHHGGIGLVRNPQADRLDLSGQQPVLNGERRWLAHLARCGRTLHCWRMLSPGDFRPGVAGDWMPVY